MPNSGCSYRERGPDGRTVSAHITALILYLCFSSFPPISLTHPLPGITSFPACQTPGSGLSLLHAVLSSARWQGLSGTSSACPSPLLSFVEAAPLGHEARGRAIAIGRRELHTGRGDRRGGREFSQTHSQPGNCGKAGRPTDQEQGLREPEAA